MQGLYIIFIFRSLPVLPWVVVTGDGYWLRGEELSAKSGAVNLQGIVQFIRLAIHHYFTMITICKMTCDEALTDLDSSEEDLEDEVEE